MDHNNDHKYLHDIMGSTGPTLQSAAETMANSMRTFASENFTHIIKHRHLGSHFIIFSAPLALRKVSSLAPRASWSSLFRDESSTRTEELALDQMSVRGRSHKPAISLDVGRPDAYHSIMLVISHLLRVASSNPVSILPFVGCTISILVCGKLTFFDHTLWTYPAGIDVAVTELVQEPALDFFGLNLGVTLGAEAHDIFILPGTVEMRAAYWISCLWWLARVVPTFLPHVNVA